MQRRNPARQIVVTHVREARLAHHRGELFLRGEVADGLGKIGVGAARDGEQGGKFGIGEGGKPTGHSGENKEENDRRAAVVTGRADGAENTGANDRGNAEGGKVDDAQVLLQPA